MSLLGFDALQLPWIALTVLLAFVVRGVSGFGSSMIGVGSLSILLPPVQVVPAMLALELLTTVHLLVSLCLLGIALLMLSGLAQRLAPRRTPGPLGALGAGMASGLLNGAAGIGGPPAIVFYFATTGAAISRATLITYFLVIDVWALAWAGASGVLSSAGWPLIVVALPFSMAGIWLGHRLYLRLDEARLRRLVWWLLAALGGAGLASALLQRAG